ncbi:hypothetical protein [Stenoxybacter acetivorans]|uniref:hypothetical protein n=1 Tax=Stenoxybacter acetivorans TaxID=422441 RepID=UPI0012EBA90C|nr:hypothetical protein [Stenoxybacter acetivorans]
MNGETGKVTEYDDKGNPKKVTVPFIKPLNYENNTDYSTCFAVELMQRTRKKRYINP